MHSRCRRRLRRSQSSIGERVRQGSIGERVTPSTMPTIEAKQARRYEAKQARRYNRGEASKALCHAMPLQEAIQRQRAPHLQQLAHARMDACAATSMRVCRKTLDASAATSMRVCNHALQLACTYDTKTLGASLVAGILVASATILVASAAKTLPACRLHSRSSHTYAHT